jgi:hypothetical protein
MNFLENDNVLKLLGTLTKARKPCLNGTFNKAFEELLCNYYSAKENLEENGNEIGDVKMNNSAP